MRAGGSHRASSRPIRSQVTRWRWLRRRSARSQCRVTCFRNADRRGCCREPRSRRCARAPRCPATVPALGWASDALPEQGVHLAQLGRHFLRDRLAPQREPSRPGFPAHVREAEERERLGPAKAAPPAVPAGEPPELDQAGLLGVELQVEPGKTFHKVRMEPLGVRTMPKTNNDVVGETHDDHITASLPVPPVPGPQIKDVVQVDVGEQGGCAGPLRAPPRLPTTTRPRSLPRSAISG